MIRSGHRKMRLIALVALGTVWSIPVGASDGSSETRIMGSEFEPYLSVGLGTVRSTGTRFKDGEESGNAALYGDNQLFDSGAFDENVIGQIAVGLQLPSGFRGQLELGLGRDLAWKGNTNYLSSGEHQPSKAKLDVRQLLLAGFYDFQGWKLGSGRSVRPFLGGGIGITDYDLRDYVQRFPDPDNPAGGLRRGPNGEVPFTALPGGNGQSFTWMLTAGFAVPIMEGVHLDFSYRYTDARNIRTEVGDINIVRYRADGTRRDIPVTINETSADYQTQAIFVAVRFAL